MYVYKPTNSTVLYYLLSKEYPCVSTAINNVWVADKLAPVDMLFLSVIE